MNSIKPQCNIFSEWFSLVNDAVSQCDYQVDDAVRHYLTITLEHYSTDAKLASVVIALDFLHGLEFFGRQGCIELRQVGDRCLLLAGLFPEQVQKKNITNQYYINVGRQAYESVAQFPLRNGYNAELFHVLSDEFSHLTLILKAMRNLQPAIH